ncbi:MAG: acylphosphatase [Burkholderiales bacterium]
MRTSKHLVVSGLVQGVFYRDSLCAEAVRLGVTGWVRNRSDGTVEATVQGEPAAIERIIEWSRRGPPMARVEKVLIGEGSGEYSRFERWPTL